MRIHKAGYKTSEFWFTVVSFLFSGLYLVGVIGDLAYKDELIRDVSHAVESVILIGGQLIIVYNYMKSRSHIKESELKVINATPEPEQTVMEKEDVIKPRKSRKPTKPSNKSSSKKQRTSSSRSRKTNSSD